MSDIYDVIQTSPYVQAWLFYLLGALGCVVVFWRMTRHVWPFLQIFLRAATAVFLLMPIRLQPTVEYWVPTWMYVTMKTISKDFAGAAPGLRQLLVVTVFVVLATWLIYALLQRFKKASAAHSS